MCSPSSVSLLKRCLFLSEGLIGFSCTPIPMHVDIPENLHAATANKRQTEFKDILGIICLSYP